MLKKYLAVCISIVPINAFSAPITFNTALPVSDGEFILRELVEYSKSTDDPTTSNKELTKTTAKTAIVYGITPDIALFTVIPYTNKKLETSSSTRNSNGIGDIRTFIRYTAYQNNFKGGTFRIAPFAGLELPTGKNNKFDNLGKQPASVQNGSGSLDLFGGLVLTYGTTNWEFDGQISYQQNNEEDNLKAGNIARADASIQYRVLEDFSSHDPWFLNGVLETGLIYKNKNETFSTLDTNTGGTTLTVSPGIQFTKKRWIAEAGIQIPVVQNLNGTSLKNDFTIFTGIRINF